MHFSKLQLKSFRNISEATVEFCPGLNILVGENGQGKTNFIESLYFATQGETFRQGDSKNLVSFSSESAFIYTEVLQAHLKHDIEVKISRDKIECYLNRKKTTKTNLMKTFCAILFSPESLLVIKDSAESRRNLIDEALVSFKKSNSDLISQFKKTLKTRNKILKQHLSTEISTITAKNLLEAIFPAYFKSCLELTLARIDLLNNIREDLNSAMQYISQRTDMNLEVEYLVSDQVINNENINLLKETLQKRMEELRNAELSSGTSLVGPHKHDVKFNYNGNDSRFFCSQGQQRAIILSFKMAQVLYHKRAHGDYPVLMLDDVLSELDQFKREALISFLHNIQTQIFVTSTDLSLSRSFNLEGLIVKNVSKGRLF